MIILLKSLTKLQTARCTLFRQFASGLNLWNEELTSEIKHKIEDYWEGKLTFEKYYENEHHREKYYVLSMFPYPSGSLHMGHVRVYTISDAIARFQRMNGKNVINPIGWDAFGLPAENAAIERQIPPNEWTQTNITQMKAQLQRLGCSFEWDREIATCDPSYYKWTQDLFLKLYDAGLVYQKKAMVNWDPVDLTVLADEQVDENGCSWRSGAKVEKKPLRQWFIRTTRFAKDLLDGLDDPLLQDWRDVIKLQKHWIGECDGVNFDFKIAGSDDFVTLWTSTPERIRNAKFVAIQSNHILNNYESIALNDGTKKLKMVLVNPLNLEEIPVFATDEIEFLPFTNTYLGIPGICPKATSFAKKYNIQYEQLQDLAEQELLAVQEKNCREAQELKVGGYWSSAKLKDWLISRQRFWGTPIPIVYCDNCGTQPIRDTPVKLPVVSKLPQKGGSSLLNHDSWIDVPCPKCNQKAKRETDTMDTFVDSSWYYLRYLDNQNEQTMFDVTKVRKGMPVDLYIGGKEHAVLHLYYARFIGHFLHSQGLLAEREPFKRLLVQGMVMGQSYRIKGSGKYVSANEVDFTDKKKKKAVLKSTGESVVLAWEKMSKSKHNGVDPDDMFKEYGCDTTRLLILADVAPTSHRNWNSNTFPGIINWQKRLWLTVRDFIKHRNTTPPSISDEEFRTHCDYMYDSRNYYIKGVTFNYCGSQQHSVAISKQQGLTNSLRKMPAAVVAKSLQYERALSTQIVLLAPMAPSFASELWAGFLSAPNRLNFSGEILWDKSVFEQKWPTIDSDYQMDLVCKVNGNDICVIKIPKNDFEKLNQEQALKLAIDHKDISVELLNKTVLRSHLLIQPEYNIVLNITTSGRQKEQEANI